VQASIHDEPKSEFVSLAVTTQPLTRTVRLDQAARMAHLAIVALYLLQK
jgi:hypothetical protein